MFAFGMMAGAAVSLGGFLIAQSFLQRKGLREGDPTVSGPAGVGLWLAAAWLIYHYGL